VPYIYSPYIPLQVMKQDKHTKKKISKFYSAMIRKLIPKEISEKRLKIRYQKSRFGENTYEFDLYHKCNCHNFNVHNFKFIGNNVQIFKRIMNRDKDGKWLLSACGVAQNRIFDISDPDFVDDVRRFFGEK